MFRHEVRDQRCTREAGRAKMKGADHVSGHDEAGVQEGVPSCVHGRGRHGAAGAEIEEKLHMHRNNHLCQMMVQNS